MGLRERKKRECEDKILKVSKEILLSKGYSNTTMEEIAEKAEIGVGTLYNYFKSKAEIFIAIMSEEVLLEEEDICRLENDLESDVADIVLDFVWKSLKNIKIIGKRAWKELFSAVFSMMKSENALLKGVMMLDYKFIDKLKKLLENVKNKGLLPLTFDTEQAAYAVYSVLITQFILYTYNEETSFEDLTQNAEKQIRFIFDGKCSMSKEGVK